MFRYYSEWYLAETLKLYILDILKNYKYFAPAKLILSYI